MGRLLIPALLAAAVLGQTTVPFVGCKSDGQVGPRDAPKGKDPVLPIPAEAAQHLAYYTAGGTGVLGPRGWHCFRLYGSAGDELYVSPRTITPQNTFSGEWNGFTGPGVELAGRSSATSGRVEVAQAILRLFPAHRAFADELIQESALPKSSFPSGPYPTDKLTYRGAEVAEYQTPPQTEGTGTTAGMVKDADPIRGVAMLLGKTPDLLLLSVRLPAELSSLTPIIIQQVEREALPH